MARRIGQTDQAVPPHRGYLAFRGEGKELAVELVMVLLAVILLVVLPVSFLVLMIGGLVYSVFRAIRGEKKDVHPADRA